MYISRIYLHLEFWGSSGLLLSEKIQLNWKTFQARFTKIMKYVEWLPCKIRVCRLGFFSPLGEKSVHGCLDYGGKMTDITVLLSWLMLRVIKFCHQSCACTCQQIERGFSKCGLGISYVIIQILDFMDYSQMLHDVTEVIVFIFQLMSCGLLETLKFSVLELQEHLDTYNVKREAAEQVSLLYLKSKSIRTYSPRKCCRCLSLDTGI